MVERMTFQTDDPATWGLRDELLPGDIEAIRRITEATGMFHSPEVDVAEELVRDRLARGTASDYLFLVGLLDDLVVAWACFGAIACTFGSFDLYWIVTDPRYQGRGLGRRLLTEVEQRVLTAGGARLFVDTSARPQYEPTRRFYANSGYHEAARVPDFYTAGEAKVIFVKNLPAV